MSYTTPPIGPAGTPSPEVLTVQGIAGATPISVTTTASTPVVTTLLNAVQTTGPGSITASVAGYTTAAFENLVISSRFIKLCLILHTS